MRRLGPALEVRDFKLWWLALMGMGISLQMMEVAIGWEVYALHRSALDLGWIGLAEFMPMFLLALPAGHLADRVSRRLIFAGALLLGCGVGVGLALVSAAGVTSVVPYLALAVGSGTAMALGTPAARAMTPTLVSTELLGSAMTLRSIATQAGQVVGPALGGLLYGVSPSLVYLLAAASCLAACGCALAMNSSASGRVAETDEAELARAPGLRSVSEGLVFVRRTPILLGADLLAVLFGGAVAPAADRRLPVRGEHGRVRAVAHVRDLADRARGLGLRRPVLDEHPRHDGGTGVARPAPRAGQRRRDGVHQRLQPARCVRVRAGGLAGRHRGRRARQRLDVSARGVGPDVHASRRRSWMRNRTVAIRCTA